MHGYMHAYVHVGKYVHIVQVFTLEKENQRHHHCHNHQHHIDKRKCRLRYNQEGREKEDRRWNGKKQRDTDVRQLPSLTQS